MTNHQTATALSWVCENLCNQFGQLGEDYTCPGCPFDDFMSCPLREAIDLITNAIATQEKLNELEVVQQKTARYIRQDEATSHLKDMYQTVMNVAINRNLPKSDTNKIYGRWVEIEKRLNDKAEYGFLLVNDEVMTNNGFLITDEDIE